MLQVSSRFTALLREGWLQYRPESTGMKLLGRSWKVGWFELLADGKLTWFPSPDKRHNENRSALPLVHSPASNVAPLDPQCKELSLAADPGASCWGGV